MNFGVFSTFIDADHAGNVETTWSTTGWVFEMAGATSSWSSKLQHSVLISSTEAEYYTASGCAREAIWMRWLFAEMGYEQDGPTLIRGNNQGSIILASHPTSHAATKHIEVHFHFMRERIITGKVILHWIPTRDMVVDVLTKGFDAVKHVGFVKSLGLVDVHHEEAS